MGTFKKQHFEEKVDKAVLSKEQNQNADQNMEGVDRVHQHPKASHFLPLCGFNIFLCNVRFDLYAVEAWFCY